MRIINIEGIEKIGKTTLIESIKKQYPSDKYNIEYVKFPSDDCTSIMNDRFVRIKQYQERIKGLLLECDNINFDSEIFNNLTTVLNYIITIKDLYKELSEINIEDQLSWFVNSLNEQNETMKSKTYICDRSLLSTFYTNYVHYYLYDLTCSKWNDMLESLYKYYKYSEYSNKEDRKIIEFIRISEKFNKYKSISKFVDLKRLEPNNISNFYYKSITSFNNFVYDCINNMRDNLCNYVSNDVLDSIPILYRKCVNTVILKLADNNTLDGVQKFLKYENKNSNSEKYKDILDDNTLDIYKSNVSIMNDIIDLSYNDCLSWISKYFGSKIYTVPINQIIANDRIIDLDYRIEPETLTNLISMKFSLDKSIINQNKPHCCICGSQSRNNNCICNKSDYYDKQHLKSSKAKVVRRSMNVRIESEDNYE